MAETANSQQEGGCCSGRKTANSLRTYAQSVSGLCSTVSVHSGVGGCEVQGTARKRRKMGITLHKV